MFHNLERTPSHQTGRLLPEKCGLLNVNNLKINLKNICFKKDVGQIQFFKFQSQIGVLTVKLWLLQNLYFADVHITQWVDALTGLLNVLANAVWDTVAREQASVTYNASHHPPSPSNTLVLTS